MTQTQLKSSDMKSSLYMQFLGPRFPNFHRLRSYLRLRWKIHTTSTSNQHHQQHIDMRLCWKIHTTSTSNHHHLQPTHLRLRWKIRTTSKSNQHHLDPIDSLTMSTKSVKITRLTCTHCHTVKYILPRFRYSS